MNETSNVIRDQVFSLPTLLRQQYNDLEPKDKEGIDHTADIFNTTNRPYWVVEIPMQQEWQCRESLND